MNKLNVSEMLEMKDRITIDIVGDSVTWGLNQCSENETYAAQFASMLAMKYSDVSVYRYDGIAGDELEPMKTFSEPIHVGKADSEKRIDVLKNGIGGNTVRRAINRINDFTGTLANGKTADITFFMFGINDALKTDQRKYVTPDRFYNDYQELLDMFRKNDESLIVLMSATTNDQPIEEYVKMTEILAKENGLLYIDQNKIWNAHYDKSKAHFGQGDWLSDVAYDACHPTPLGAKAIAEEMMKYVV